MRGVIQMGVSECVSKLQYASMCEHLELCVFHLREIFRDIPRYERGIAPRASCFVPHNFRTSSISWKRKSKSITASCIIV